MESPSLRKRAVPQRMSTPLSWSVFAGAVLRFARSLHDPYISVIPLETLVEAGCKASSVEHRTLVMNRYGHGPGGQKTVDRLREILTEKGLRELGFATIRTSKTTAPLCPSEGWSMVVDTGDHKLLKEVVRIVEDEALHPPDISMSGKTTTAPWPAPFAPPETRADGDPRPNLASAVAPLRTGQMSIGFIDEVNGRSAETRTISISRFEAKVLAEHWISRLVGNEYMWFAHGCMDSHEMRENVYAPSRLCAIMEAGLLTSEEIDDLFAAARVRFGLRPAPDTANQSITRFPECSPNASAVQLPPNCSEFVEVTSHIMPVALTDTNADRLVAPARAQMADTENTGEVDPNFCMVDYESLVEADAENGRRVRVRIRAELIRQYADEMRSGLLQEDTCEAILLADTDSGGLILCEEFSATSNARVFATLGALSSFLWKAPNPMRLWVLFLLDRLSPHDPELERPIGLQ